LTVLRFVLELIAQGDGVAGAELVTDACGDEGQARGSRRIFADISEEGAGEDDGLWITAVMVDADDK
jgi:hypothetical protein